jgi:hypothetical protein
MVGFLKALDTPAGNTIGLIREDGQAEDCSVIPAASILGAPLSGAWWVDPGTPVATADQTGTIGAPFATLAQAIAAAQADYTANVRSQTIWLAPADYQAEGLQTIAMLGQTLSLINWQQATNFLTVLLPEFNVTGELTLIGVAINAPVTCTGSIFAQRGVVTGLCTCNGIQAYNFSVFSAGGTVTGTAFFNASVPSGVWTITGRAVLTACPVDTSPFTVTGAVQLDGYTAAIGRSLITGTAVQVFDNPTQETLSIVVPAVLAGQVGYVDTAFAGPLVGCPQDAPIVANPTADLVAAGAGGGFINARVIAGNSVRCAFVGPLAGGAVNFTFAALMFP